MSKQWFLFLFLALVYSKSTACNLQDNWLPFHEAATNAELVVRGKVISHLYDSNDVNTDLGLIVEIEQNIWGNEERKYIIIWTDHHLSLCNTSVSSFPINSSWLFALRSPNQKKQTYYFSNCSENYVRLEQETVEPKSAYPSNMKRHDEPQSFEHYVAKILETKQKHPTGIISIAENLNEYLNEKRKEAGILPRNIESQTLRIVREGDISKELSLDDMFELLRTSESGTLKMKSNTEKSDKYYYLTQSMTSVSLSDLSWSPPPMILEDAHITGVERSDWKLILLGSLLWALCLGWMCERKT